MPATHRFLPFLPPNQQHQSTERKKKMKNGYNKDWK